MSKHNLYNVLITTLSTSLHEAMQKLYYCSRASPCALACIVTKEIKHAAGLDHVIAELVISTFNPTTKDVFGETDLELLANAETEISYPLRRCITGGKRLMLNKIGYVEFSNSELDAYYNQGTTVYGLKYGEDWVDYLTDSYEYKNPKLVFEEYMAEHNLTESEARSDVAMMMESCSLCDANFYAQLQFVLRIGPLRKRRLTDE